MTQPHHHLEPVQPDPDGPDHDDSLLAIWRIHVFWGDVMSVQLAEARVVHVAEDHASRSVAVWVLHAPALKPNVQIDLRITMDDQIESGWSYQGTVPMSDGLVWHVHSRRGYL